MDACDKANPPNSMQRRVFKRPSKATNDDGEDSVTLGLCEQYDAMVAYIKSWRAKESIVTGRKVIDTYPALEYANVEDRERLEQLEYGQLAINMLNTTGLHWGAHTSAAMSSHARTLACFAMNNILIHEQHTLQYLELDDFRSMRKSIQTIFFVAFDGKLRFWDDIEIRTSPPAMPPAMPTQSGIPPLAKVALTNIALSMEKKVQHGIKNIAKILRHKELGAIPHASGDDEDNKRGGDLRVTEGIHKAAMILFKVGGNSCLCRKIQ
jgi:hypothetical protein